MRAMVLLVGVALLSVRTARAEGAVPVQFVSEDVESSTIEVDGTRCHTPCTLSLTPGSHMVIVLDHRNNTRRLRVPGVPSIVRLKDNGQAALIVGIVSVALGVATIPVWAWLLQPYQCPSADPLCPGLTTIFRAWSVLGAVGSVLLTLEGIIVLGIWSANPPTADLVAASLTTKSPSLKLTSIGLTPLRNGLSAGLGFSF